MPAGGTIFIYDHESSISEDALRNLVSLKKGSEGRKRGVRGEEKGICVCFVSKKRCQKVDKTMKCAFMHNKTMSSEDC
jgi:hypothetical protein